MKERKVEPEYPDCSAGYLVTILFEVGPTMAAGMGEAPLSQLEIASWQANTGVELTTWEARTLRSLSMAYLLESQCAKDPARHSPLAVLPSDEDRQKKLPKRIKNVLRG